MKKLYALFLFCSFFLLAGCSPIYVVRLDPSATEVPDRMLYGNAVLSKQLRDIEVNLSYYDASPAYLVFNLEVHNGSARAFDFNPADITITPEAGPSQNAIDPEFQLLSMDMQDARRRKNSRTMAWAGTALMVAAAVASASGELASSSDAVANSQLAADVSFELSNLLLTAVSDANVRSMQHYSIPREEIPLPNSRFFWLDHTLRITTVQPGERIVGKLVFPRMDDARRFAISVPLPGGDTYFEFDQRVFRP